MYRNIFLLLLIVLKCQTVEIESPVVYVPPPAIESGSGESSNARDNESPDELAEIFRLVGPLLTEPFEKDSLIREISTGTYEGNKKKDLYSGKGKLVWEAQESFSGNFKNGRIEGDGVLQKVISIQNIENPRLIVVSGKIKDNQFQGKTTYLVSNNDRDVPNPKSFYFKFEGNFIKDKPVDGKIIFKQKLESFEFSLNLTKESKKKYAYKGDIEIFKDNLKFSYKGEFNHELKPHGKLTYSSDIETFVGNYFDGLREGNGKIKFKDGEYNDGIWKKDLFIKGKTKRDYGEGLYEGEIIGENPEGKGKLIFTGGNFFEGMFKNGIYEGQGKLKEDNRIYNGIFKEGKLYKGTITEDGFVRYSVNDFESEDSPQYIAKVKREEAQEEARIKREKAAAKGKCNSLVNYVRPRFDCGSYCFEKSVYRNGFHISLITFCALYYCPQDPSVCDDFNY